MNQFIEVTTNGKKCLINKNNIIEVFQQVRLNKDKETVERCTISMCIESYIIEVDETYEEIKFKLFA
jgi:hypothetical protein